MLLAGRLAIGRHDLGENLLLTVIAAVVIGGTNLFGGRASVAGAIVGVGGDGHAQQRPDPDGPAGRRPAHRPGRDHHLGGGAEHARAEGEPDVFLRIPAERATRSSCRPPIELHQAGSDSGQQLRARPRHDRGQHGRAVPAGPPARPHRLRHDQADRPGPGGAGRHGLAGGVDGFVAVDMACARPIVRRRATTSAISAIWCRCPGPRPGQAAGLEPDYWTVFSENKAAEAAAAAHRPGQRSQRLLVRVFADGDEFYAGHEGGVALDDLPAMIDRIAAMPGAEFRGADHLPGPAVRLRHRAGPALTPNVETLARAAEIARRRPTCPADGSR